MVLRSTNWRACSVTPNRDLGLSLLSLVHGRGERAAAVFKVPMEPTLMDLGHTGAPNNQRPSSSARLRAFDRSAKAENTKDPPEP